MRIEAERDSLLAAVAMVCGVVPSKPSRAELGFLRLRVPDILKATVHGTDLEIHLECAVKLILLEGPGELLLPAHQLLAVLRAMPAGEVAIKVEGTEAVISSTGMVYRLETGDPEKLPDVPLTEPEWKLVATGGKLRLAVKRVSYAASTDHSRFNMNGVHLRFNKHTLQAIATDGRRLAMAEFSLVEEWLANQSNPPYGAPDPITVPNRAVDVMEKVALEFAVFSWTKRQLRVEWFIDGILEVAMTTVLIEGKFPDVDAVWPKGKAGTQFEIGTENLLSGIKRASVCVDSETRRMGLRIRPHGLTLESRGTGRGQATVDLAVDVVGDELDLNLNPTYLADCVRHCGESATVSVKGDGHPVVIGGDYYSALVMPLT